MGWTMASLGCNISPMGRRAFSRVYSILLAIAVVAVLLHSHGQAKMARGGTALHDGGEGCPVCAQVGPGVVLQNPPALPLPATTQCAVPAPSFQAAYSQTIAPFSIRGPPASA